MNYSKFDKINYDTDSDEENKQAATIKPSAVPMSGNVADLPNIANDPVVPTKMTAKTKEGRLKFEYQGRTVYEWEQNLDEVNIYIYPPPGMPRKMINVKITHKHLSVGLNDPNVPPFIDEDIFGPVKVDECTWTLVDGELNITLCKMNKAETWMSALLGGCCDNILYSMRVYV